MAEKARKGLHRQFKLREAKRHHRNFSRQVSLETGFNALNRECKAKYETRALPRSGRSFGGFDSIDRINIGETRKGDFSIFKTKATLSKQNSLMPGRKEKDIESQRLDGSNGHDDSVNEGVPAGRYFAALRGPELDQIKDHEDILLPKDEKWPFLLRFPIGCFGICLGLSSQAVLWRALATSPATKFLHITPFINLALWLLAVAVLFSISFTYILKCMFYFEAVRREYFHPVRVNFFFAPWVVCMFLAISAPPMLAPENLHPALWCTFMDHISSSSSRFMANGFPVERDVFARDCPQAKHCLKSCILCILCSLQPHQQQVLPGNLFMDSGKTYTSLDSSLTWFSVAWWSYTFPMTTVSVATIKYAEQVPAVLSKVLALSLSFMSSTMVSLLFVSTLLHAFFWRTLFPNDLAIAITKKRLVKERKPLKKVYDIRRWTRQAPNKHNQVNKNFCGENDGLQTPQ
ncbi:hypothetical protein GH714_029269 [Hevea brasiliensis]|uniref:Uncharacterized protein n=1 Tax=Hevea brasiliensis TaxID=3981 RepID=A0A6A6LEP8_HEVBR|nr:hypothetical protein GH714_029269 [Hevea brasiliensis]